MGTTKFNNQAPSYKSKLQNIILKQRKRKMKERKDNK